MDKKSKLKGHIVGFDFDPKENPDAHIGNEVGYFFQMPDKESALELVDLLARGMNWFDSINFEPVVNPRCSRVHHVWYEYGPLEESYGHAYEEDIPEGEIIHRLT